MRLACVIGFGVYTAVKASYISTTFSIRVEERNLIYLSPVVLIASVVMFSSRLRAYRLFKVAMLISVFLTQIFEFYDIQFAALFGLAFNLVGLGLADSMITEERTAQSQGLTR